MSRNLRKPNAQKKAAVTPARKRNSIRDTAQVIVGIGASAGGLEALQVLVRSLPPESGMAYVIAQHLSPQHRSMMVELLQRHTPLPVEAIADGAPALSNVIYVTPPDKDVFLAQGLLRLRAPQTKIGPKPSIDYFFTSLASQLQDKAIGIVLSGTGSDGSLGMRAIKAAGGITIAQEPGTAKYDSMPQSAIRSGSADLVLPPDRIAALLPAIVLRPPPVILEGSARNTYGQILDRLYQNHRVDFRNYKDATLQRQMARRMTALQLPDLEKYQEYIEAHPEELEQLLQRFLISVTSFFRDSEHFLALRKILRQLIDQAAKSKQLRIWVPGCASGEEAYSIAILLAEELGARLRELDIKIFATDLDERATDQARRGIYPEASLADLSTDLIQRYFDLVGRTYVVRKRLRETIVFARHDVIQDPPFLQVDLISCRNLFIYFKNDLQEKMFGLFHYALQEGGYLFLGKAETNSHGGELFATVDAKHRIYRRNAIQTPRNILVRSGLPLRNSSVSVAPRSAPEAAMEHLNQRLVQAYAPPTVLVDGEGNCAHFFGDLTSFVTIPAGAPSMHLPTIVLPRLRADVQALLNRVKSRGESSVGHYQTFGAGGKQRSIRIAVRPAGGGNGNGQSRDLPNRYFISFEEREVPPRPRSGKVAKRGGNKTDAEFEALELELVQSNQHVQAVVEELESTNEELQSVNEELQASAEELQSSNEELETTNEELQASNEELATVNEELQTKTVELSEANEMLENVQVSLEKPLVLVDKKLLVTRVTPAASKLFDLHSGDVGRSVLHVRRFFKTTGLARRMGRVISTGAPNEEVVVASGVHYQLHITPYKDGFGKIEGALLAFTDISAVMKAEAGLRASESRLKQILEGSPLSNVGVDGEGTITFISHRALELFGYDRDELLGARVEKLVPAAAREEHVKFWTAYMADPQHRRTAFGRDLMAVRRDGTRFPVEVSLSPITTDLGTIIVCGIVDLTDRKRAERALRERNEALNRSNESLRQFAYVASHDLQEPLRMIAGHLQLLNRRSRMQLDEKAQGYVDYAMEGAKRMQGLIAGLLSYARIGSATLTCGPVDMNALTEQVTVDLGRLIKDNKATVTKDSLPVVHGDAVQCRQLLQNLISNGIKFRNAEPPRIHLSASDEGDWWRFSVRDNGIGVPPEYRERIFEVFQRLHTREEVPGDGLGLSICKRIVEMHGGSIGVDGAPDHGSVFHFTLPKQDA